MRKFGLLTLLFLSFLIKVDFVHAQTPTSEFIEPIKIEPIEVRNDEMVVSGLIMPPYQPAIYHFGQDHRYSVILRGNGEAVVYFRGAFTNETDEPINEIKLGTQEGVNLKQLSAYQIQKKPHCANYNPDGGCQSYTDPDYYEPYSYGGTTEYNKVQTELDDEYLTVKLVDEVMPGSQGAILLFYRADGVADKTALGGYDYNFETFRVDDNIKLISVGLEGDPDWRFKGAETMIGYVSTLSSSADSMAVMEKVSPDSRNASFDSVVSSLGYGMITKSANGLAPMENMSVEGSYAKNYLALYYKEIGVVATILLIFLGIVAILVIKLYRNSKKSETQPDGSKTNNLKIMMVVSNLLIPTISVMFTVGVIIFFQLISNVSYNYTAIYPLTMILIMVSFLFFFSIFVGSAIYFGVKKGVGWGIANVFINLFIYLLLMFMVIAVMYAFMGGVNQIMPYRGGVGVMDAAKPM